MAKSIKIAPDLNEVQLNRNIVSTSFNGLRIEYTMPEDEYLRVNPFEARNALQCAIGFASKSWQIENAMNNFFKWNGSLKVTNLETNKVIYPVK